MPTPRASRLESGDPMPGPHDLCDHCGLPARALGYRARGDSIYCCYGCYLASRIVGGQQAEGAPAWVLARFGVGAFLAMNVMMISLLLYAGELEDLGDQATVWFRWALLGLSAPALIILGHPFVAGMAREIRRLRPSLDSLATMGSFSAFGVSAVHVVRGAGPIYFDTATMLLALMTVGKLLEASAKSKTAGVIRGLLRSRPAEARVEREGHTEVLPASQVQVGDLLRVRPGERIPVDGEVVSGSSSVQEAGFTGEPGPRACAAGSLVYGGSVNAEGEVVVRARAVADDSLLAQVAHLTELAAAGRAPIERLVDRVSSVFIPFVALAALGALAYWVAQGQPARGGMSALAVLVVACPCALGLATPLVTSLAIGRAARNGVLIRSGEALELLPRVTRAFFDKTGTLTTGALGVTEVEACASPPLAAEEVLPWVATLETASEHPLGKAIAATAAARGLSLGRVANYRAFPGQGASGQVELGGKSREVFAGTPEFLERFGVRVPETTASGGGVGEPTGTRIYAGWREPASANRPDAGASCGNGPDAEASGCASPLIRITLTDSARPEAKGVVHRLHEMGVRTAILSGDRREAARALADLVGIDDVTAPCLPDEKIRVIQETRGKGEIVAMVGDGINDAPALAAADVGVALGGGTDLAREAGDVTLLGDRLDRLPWLIDLGHQAHSAIRRNLAWAFGYNVVAITAAFLGFLHPLIAVLAMLGSSAFILSNSVKVARG